jgi:hypothetical protein
MTQAERDAAAERCDRMIEEELKHIHAAEVARKTRKEERVN